MKYMSHALSLALLLSANDMVITGPDTQLATASSDTKSTSATLHDFSVLVGTINSYNQTLSIQIDQALIFKENDYQGADFEQLKQDGRKTMQTLRQTIREAKTLSNQLAQHIQASNIPPINDFTEFETAKFNAEQEEIAQRSDELKNIVKAVKANMHRAGVKKKKKATNSVMPDNTSQSESSIDIEKLQDTVIIDPQILPSSPIGTQNAKRSWLNFWSFGLFGKNS